jgi:hypothetical protein
MWCAAVDGREDGAVAGEGVPLMASSVVLMLVGAGRFLQRRVDDELAALGLTLRHLSALGHLSHRPDLSYSDLARRARITTQSMHATVRLAGGARRRAGACWPGTGTPPAWRSPTRAAACSGPSRTWPPGSTASCSPTSTTTSADVLAGALRELVVPSALGRLRSGPA